MHCDSHKVHALIDSDDEYDDLLGDISKWGDKKDAATSKTCRIDFDIFSSYPYARLFSIL